MAICSFNNVAVKTARSQAILTEAGTNCEILIYTGAPPGDASMAATGGLLATLPCSATLGTVTEGVSGGAKPYLTFNAITTENGTATGEPGYARVQTSTGIGIVDLDIGAAGSGAYIIFTPNQVTEGSPVAMTTLVITEA